MVLALFRKRIADDKPQVVLALTDSAFAEALASQLRAGGWGVHLADSSAVARKMTVKHSARVVVVSVARPDESGYLTCAKLKRCRAKPRVLLLGDDVSQGREAFAAYVGATDCLSTRGGPRAIAARVQSLAPVMV